MRPILSCCGLAAAVVLTSATSALAAKPASVRLECQANKAGWNEPREFTVDFVRIGSRLRAVDLNEKARVFTPTDAKAAYREQKKAGWGLIIDIPDKRPGKWSGSSDGDTDQFELKSGDGSASFAVTPDATDKTLRHLTWKAAMTGPDGDQLTAEGVGTCRLVSAEVENPAAVEAAAPAAPKLEATQASKGDVAATPEKPRKEIRLFGSRKGAVADRGEK